MRGVEKLEIFIVQDSTSCVLGSAPTMPPYLDGAIIVRTVGIVIKARGPVQSVAQEPSSFMCVRVLT